MLRVFIKPLNVKYHLENDWIYLSLKNTSTVLKHHTFAAIVIVIAQENNDQLFIMGGY